MLSNEEEEGTKYEEVQAWGHRHQQMYIATVFVATDFVHKQLRNAGLRDITIFKPLHTFKELEIAIEKCGKM